MVYTGKKSSAHSKVKEKTNIPTPFAKDPSPRPRVTIKKDERGRVRTFDVRTGTYQWLPIIHAH